jgi:hypothetical protein
MKPKKTRERGNQTKNRAVTVLLFVPVLILLSPLTSQTLGSWEIYNDTDITSGSYGLIDIYDTAPNNTTVNFYGDVADYIGTHDSSTLNFFGGEAEIGAFDTSLVNISGGTLSSIRAWDEAIVNFSGTSDATALSASHSSIVNMTNGTVYHIGSSESGVFNLYGGTVTDRIYSIDSAEINIYGYDLVKTSTGGTYGYGQVYGFLIDDSYIFVDFSNQEAYDRVKLIPAIRVQVNVLPKTVNLASKGKWVSYEISIPNDYNARGNGSAMRYLFPTIIMPTTLIPRAYCCKMISRQNGYGLTKTKMSSWARLHAHAFEIFYSPVLSNLLLAATLPTALISPVPTPSR